MAALSSRMPPVAVYLVKSFSRARKAARLIFSGVGNSGSAAQDGVGPLLHCVVHGEPLEGVHRNVLHAPRHVSEHLDALRGAEERLLFEIDKDGHNQVIEKAAAALD